MRDKDQVRPFDDDFDNMEQGEDTPPKFRTSRLGSTQEIEDALRVAENARHSALHIKPEDIPALVASTPRGIAFIDNTVIAQQNTPLVVLGSERFREYDKEIPDFLDSLENGEFFRIRLHLTPNFCFEALKRRVISSFATLIQCESEICQQNRFMDEVFEEKRRGIGQRRARILQIIDEMQVKVLKENQNLESLNQRYEYVINISKVDTNANEVHALIDEIKDLPANAKFTTEHIAILEKLIHEIGLLPVSKRCVKMFLDLPGFKDISDKIRADVEKHLSAGIQVVLKSPKTIEEYKLQGYSYEQLWNYFYSKINFV